MKRGDLAWLRCGSPYPMRIRRIRFNSRGWQVMLADQWYDITEISHERRND
jgi:hypothetical protein